MCYMRDVTAMGFLRLMGCVRDVRGFEVCLGSVGSEVCVGYGGFGGLSVL